MAARIPDVITPNGDTKNDFFHFDLPCTPDKFLITIYNPQREIIFTSDNQQFKWDGKDLKRQDAQLNKYMYIIVITNKDGKENSLTGELIVYL